MPTPLLITSPANPQIKSIRALELRKNRKETGLFIAEGLRTVIEGVELGYELQTLVIHHDNINRADVQSVIQKCRGSILQVNDAVLEKLSHKDNPQMVIGVFRQNFEDLEAVKTGFWVALDQVRDPGNLGTIIRTVDAAGASGVILIGSCCDPYAVESVRASMGSIFAKPIITCDESAFLEWRRNFDGQVIGTTLQTDTDYKSIPYRQPLILLMGNEQAGLTDNLRKACTHNVKIPMRGRADSLNLAIATGVMIYTIKA